MAKTGKSIQELAEEIARQAEAKRDLIAPTSALAVAEDGDLVVGNGDGERFGIEDTAHGQIAERLGIPAAYYQRMRSEAPDLLAANVNRWFAKTPEKRLVRTLDGRVRAFLSDRYRTLDNDDVAEAVLPVLIDRELDIISMEITPSRLYLKAADKSITKHIPTGARMGDGSHHIFDCVSPAIVISNSEIGTGALSITTAVWTKACTNLAVFSQRSMKKYHVGSRARDMGEEVYDLLSDDTRRKTDEAVFAQVGDVVAGAFDRVRFEALADSIGRAADDKIEGDVVKVVEVARKKLDLTEKEGGSILAHLIRGGDLTRYGLSAAITRASADVESYDRASQLEAVGGELIDLAPSQWRVIATAAD